ncbi:protein E48B [Elephant endotheliotropic herpesvirus 2]|nr:protein E48B [Elephant endotheliotropic herpesvirus 2]
MASPTPQQLYVHEMCPSYISSLIGFLITLIVIPLYLYIYKQQKLIFQNAYFVQFLLLLGVAYLFLFSIILCYLDSAIHYTILFQSSPYVICFCSTFILSLNFFIIYNYKQILCKFILIYMLMFLIFLAPIICFYVNPGKFNYLVQHPYMNNMYLYIYYLIINTLCLCFFSCTYNTYTKMFCLTMFITFIIWNVNTFAFNLYTHLYLAPSVGYTFIFCYFIPLITQDYKQKVVTMFYQFYGAPPPSTLSI